MCKTVEIFLYWKFGLDLSTLFPVHPVEKPVENVDNSCGMWNCSGFCLMLCLLINDFISFSTIDICFLCK